MVGVDEGKLVVGSEVGTGDGLDVGLGVGGPGVDGLGVGIGVGIGVWGPVVITVGLGVGLLVAIFPALENAELPPML